MSSEEPLGNGNFKALREHLKSHQLATDVLSAWVAAATQEDAPGLLGEVVQARVEKVREELANGED